MEGILAITFIFGGGTLFLLSISPIGKAVAQRILGKAGESESGEWEDRAHQLEEELHQLRLEVGDIEERLDFTERLLARGKSQEMDVSQ